MFQLYIVVAAGLVIGSPLVAADSISIDLTSLRISNNLNQSRSSAPAIIDPAYKYYVDFSDSTRVRGQSGLMAILYPNPVPLSDLLETFSPGSSEMLHTAVLNPNGSHPFDGPAQVISGTSGSISISLTLQAQINATNVGSFSITNVILTPSVVGGLIFTQGSVVISRGCLADFNDDGGVDGGDIESFFVVWASGDAQADVNGDGGVDGGDIETFFVRWEAGC